MRLSLASVLRCSGVLVLLLLLSGRQAPWEPSLPLLQARWLCPPPARQDCERRGTSRAEHAPPDLSKGGCEYTPFYCEENVYHLCARPEFRSSAFVVLVSNAAQQVNLWKQQRGEPVQWDYHVICVAQQGGSQRLGYAVFDLDSKFDFGTPFPIYARGTFPPAARREEAKAKQRPRFRVLPAARFRRVFASDRSHMRRKDGGWHAKPPAHDAIVAENGETHTLPQLLDMSCAGGSRPPSSDSADHSDRRHLAALARAMWEQPHGVVVKLEELCALFADDSDLAVATRAQVAATAAL